MAACGELFQVVTIYAVLAMLCSGKGLAIAAARSFESRPLIIIIIFQCARTHSHTHTSSLLADYCLWET
jgi:hypothetical protein